MKMFSIGLFVGMIGMSIIFLIIDYFDRKQTSDSISSIIESDGRAIRMWRDAYFKLANEKEKRSNK